MKNFSNRVRLICTAKRFLSVTGNENKPTLTHEHLSPLILLDVDGVINYLGANKNSAWKDTKTVKVREYIIQYSPTVVECINDWGKRAEIRWLTTWDDNARTALAPKLGLDSFILARDPAKKLEKWQAALNCHNENPSRPICWVDDHLRYFQLHQINPVWYQRQRMMFMRPCEVKALTGDDIKEVYEFLDKSLEYGNNYVPMMMKKTLPLDD